jgi:hypothetical protein
MQVQFYSVFGHIYAYQNYKRMESDAQLDTFIAPKFFNNAK